MKRILTICLGLLAFAFAANATAASTLEMAARAEFVDQSTGPGILAEAGARPTELLIAERLPDGSWGIEFGFELEGRQGRMPMRVREVDSRWSVVWSPDPSYGSSLANILRSGALPQSESKREWADLRRMPAFPAIVTAKRVITPFGVIEKESSETEPGGFRRPDPRRSGPLPTSQALARHAERWIDEMLGGDPAPAGFDLIVDASINWERFNAALFSIAGIGLYLGEIVAVNDDGFAAIPFAAPIGAATGKKPPEMVMALYQIDAGWGVRLVIDKELVETGGGCPEPMAICPETPAALRADLTALTGKRKFERVMFASPGSTSTADAIAWIESAEEVLRLDAHHLFVGFIAP